MSSTGIEIIEDLFQRYSDLQACREDVYSAYTLLHECYEEGKKVLICGNGGSASDSDHITAELMKSFKVPRSVDESVLLRLRSQEDRDGKWIASHLEGTLRAISLTSQVTLITAIGNDIDSSMVFAQQVYGYGDEGDTGVRL